MSKNICVDFGHSTVKYGCEGKFDIMPSVVTEEIMAYEVNELVDENITQHLRVKFNNKEYVIGEWAKESEYAIHQNHDDDIDTNESKLLVLTAIALMKDDSNEVNLLLNLPISQYNKKKEQIRNLFQGHKINFSIYNHKLQKYNACDFYIDKVDIKPQGFYSFMDIILSDNAEVCNEDVASSTTGILDVGFFSTDVYLSEGLQPSSRIPKRKIPGMSLAYESIGEDIYKEFGKQRELYEVEQFVRNNELIHEGESYQLDNQINSAYDKLVNKIINDIKNQATRYKDVRYWYLTGGGAEPLRNRFENKFVNLQVIPNPRLSNARGGVKFSKRLWNNEKK